MAETQTDDISAIIRLGDTRDLIRQIPDNMVDAIVTDPPYELNFMTKKWDNTGIAFDQSVWEDALRVLKPGGHLLAFGAPRTFHRLIVAIEDAGFEIRDTIPWINSQGFPKGTNLTKVMAKHEGYTGEWDGWGSVLKPAFEPVVLARKPLDGSLIDNVLAFGTGALNIDACRTSFVSKADEAESKTKNRHGDFGTLSGGNSVYSEYPNTPRKNYDPTGRWPTNIIFDEYCAARLDEIEPHTRSSKGKPRSGKKGNGWGMTQTGAEYDDVGGVSRFFPVFKYHAKATSKERPKDGDYQHTTVKPLGLMQWLVRLVTRRGGLVLDLYTGSGTTAEACALEGMGFIGFEQDSRNLPLIHQRLERVGWVEQQRSQPVSEGTYCFAPQIA